MEQVLELAAGNGVRLVLGAAGTAANRVLTRLAQLLGVTPKRCCDDFREAQTVIFSPAEAHRATGESGEVTTCAGYEIKRNRRSVHLMMTESGEVDELARVRYPLMMLIMQTMLNGEPCILFHGALLERSDGAATVVIASSGVGKSTTARRFIAGGGKAQFDDQMLLCWRETASGSPEFSVHGLPTWSRVFQDGLGRECFGFERKYSLRQLYCLGRGEGAEEIRPLPLAVWHGQLVAAMLEHLVWPQAILSGDEKVAMGKFCWQLAQQLDRVFRPQQLAATLDGDLHRTLAEAPAQRYQI